MINIIVSYDRERCLARNGSLPWKLPSDRRRFRTLTIRSHVIMDSETYLSFPERFRPLRDRKNNVIANDSVEGFAPDQRVTIVPSLVKALALVGPREEAYIVGKEALLKQALSCPQVRRIYATEVATSIKGGDSFFPPLALEWRCVESSAIITHPQEDSPAKMEMYPTRLLIFRR